MKYAFKYIYKKGDMEKTAYIYADDDIEAVMKFYDYIQNLSDVNKISNILNNLEFGCVKENGEFFTNRKCEKYKNMILNGC